jgi:RNA polymerase sigma-70 factor (ECF subfamily)
MREQRYISHEEFLLFKEGNETVFDALFKQYYKLLVLFATGLLKQKETAEDIVATSFVKLWNKRASIERPEAIKNYLYTTVRNGCLNELRNEKVKSKNEKVLWLYSEWEEPVLHYIIKAETINEIVNRIELLPTQCRQVFKKFFVEGKDYTTIAQEMKLSISTVRNQKRRGLDLLRGGLLPLLYFINLLLVFYFL